MTNTHVFNRAACAIAFVCVAAVCPATTFAQSAPSSDAGQTFFDFQVEHVVTVKSARPPVIPERLRRVAFEGQVLVQYVVDERGTPEMSTFKVIKSTDNELSEAVRRAVNQSSYTPADVQGRKVKQLVQQPFTFKFGK